MKVSLNLQQEDLCNSNPFIKAKLPISIFNQPFTSIFTTPTHSLSHLSAALSTNFSSGPSLKFTYSPSTSSPSPFSLSLKSGLGLFGSPRDSPLVFSAQFSLSNSTPNSILSTFSLNFKPQFGHFSLHKTSSSNPNFESQSVPGLQIDSTTSSDSDSESGNGKLGWQEVKLEPFIGKEKEGNLSGDVGVEYLPNRQLVWLGRKKSGFLSGVAVKARTGLPLSKRVKVNLRWVLNLPDNLGAKMPSLTVNKIGLEKVEEAVKELKEKSNEKRVAAADLELMKGMCFWMARDLEIMEKENRDLKRCLEEMKHGVSAAYSLGAGTPASTDKFVEFEERRNKKNDEVNRKTEVKKSAITKPVFDLESELQRAIEAAAS